MVDRLSGIAENIQNAQEVDDDVLSDDFLPANCPVVPLGTKMGSYYYMDAMQQFRELKDKDHSRLIIQGLFGTHVEVLSQGDYARYSKKGSVDGWKPDEWAKSLMAACAVKGVFEPFEKVRGAGAWLDDDDQIVIHSGSRIFINNQSFKPGVYGSYIYPAEPQRQSPAVTLLDDGEADELLQLFKTWNWQRPDLDPYLLYGWIAAASIGGALSWRPLMWITGDKGTGKSTLHDVINGIFGNSLLSVSNTSPAGIWQKVRYSSLPVAVDEIEAEEDGRKAQAVIALARQACSGGVILRGSSEGVASEFKARNCYLFSSILIPPLMSQDRSRMAILELGRIGGTPPKINKPHLAQLGSKLLKTMISRFDVFKQNLEVISVALREQGVPSRSCDQFGTLIAAVDTVLRPRELTVQDCSFWLPRLKPLLVKEKYDNENDNVACSQHLLTSLCDVYRDGKRRTIGDFIAEAAGLENSKNSQPTDEDQKEANKILSSYGLRVVADRSSGDKFLYLANNHQGLNKLFFGTRWQGGVYRQSLLRYQGSEPVNTMRFGGMTSKCIRLPLDKLLFVGIDEMPLE